MVICARGVWRHREDEIAFWSLAPCLKKKKRKEKWKEDKRETRKCTGGEKKKQTPMTVNWRASVRVCISHRGSASGGEGCLTDGTFNWLHRRGTNVGQSSEELMQNNAGLLFLTEGPPLDQIIGQAVDSALPSAASAGGGRAISHTRPDVFHSPRPSVLLIYLPPQRRRRRRHCRLARVFLMQFPY